MTTRQQRATDVLRKITAEGPAHALEYVEAVTREGNTSSGLRPRTVDALVAVRAALRDGALVPMLNGDGSVWLHRREWLRDYPDQYTARTRLDPEDPRVLDPSTQSSMDDILGVCYEASGPGGGEAKASKAQRLRLLRKAWCNGGEG